MAGIPWLARYSEKMVRRLLLVIGVIAVAALACDPPAPSAGPAKIQVFATTLPLADLARRVGGDQVDVTWAAEAGRPVSRVRPPADRRAALSSAELVVTGGDAAWAYAGFDDPFRAGRVVRLDTLPAATGQQGFGAGYLDPAVAAAAADEIAERLTSFRPGHAAIFRANAAAAKRAITDAAGRPPAPPADPILVYSDTFVPLLTWAGVKTVSADASPTDWSDAAVARVRQIARDAGATAAAVPSDLTPAALAELQRRTGLRPVMFDALGSSAADGRDGIVAVLRYDARQVALLSGKEKGERPTSNVQRRSEERGANAFFSFTSMLDVGRWTFDVGRSPSIHRTPTTPPFSAASAASSSGVRVVRSTPSSISLRIFVSALFWI